MEPLYEPAPEFIGSLIKRAQVAFVNVNTSDGKRVVIEPMEGKCQTKTRYVQNLLAELYARRSEIRAYQAVPDDDSSYVPHVVVSPAPPQPEPNPAAQPSATQLPQSAPAPEASPFDALRHVRADGTEYWSARELMEPFDYSRWQRFADAVERAKTSITISNGEAAAQRDVVFVQVARVTAAGNLGDQRASDYHLSRRGAYRTAMCGDVNKRPIAEAQAYFIDRTEQAEQADRAAAAAPPAAPAPPSTVVVPTPTKLPSLRELAQMVISEADRADAAEAREQRMVDALEQRSDEYTVQDAAMKLSNDPAINDARIRFDRGAPIRMLIDKKWMYKRGERWHAYDAAMAAGVVAVRHEDGWDTVVITERGVMRLYQHYTQGIEIRSYR